MAKVGRPKGPVNKRSMEYNSRKRTLLKSLNNEIEVIRKKKLLAELRKEEYLAELELELLHPTILKRRKQEIYKKGLDMNVAQKEGHIYG